MVAAVRESGNTKVKVSPLRTLATSTGRKEAIRVPPDRRTRGYTIPEEPEFRPQRLRRSVAYRRENARMVDHAATVIYAEIVGAKIMELSVKIGQIVEVVGDFFLISGSFFQPELFVVSNLDLRSFQLEPGVPCAGVERVETRSSRNWMAEPQSPMLWIALCSTRCNSFPRSVNKIRNLLRRRLASRIWTRRPPGSGFGSGGPSASARAGKGSDPDLGDHPEPQP
jgi:hypothetical protein